MNDAPAGAAAYSIIQNSPQDNPVLAMNSGQDQ